MGAFQDAKGAVVPVSVVENVSSPRGIRIDVQADGSARLTTKMTNGTGGFKPGNLVQNDTSTLTREQAELFLRKIEEHKFWNLEAVDKSNGGMDGAEWIIEGVKDGSYHIVNRWSPEEGPIRAIGLFMLQNIATLRIPRNETY